MRAIEEVVKNGREALVLVPEISLTPQTIRSFRGRWDKVAVLHSHLQAAERGGHWRQIAAGQVQVVVGARSAVFAPTRKLGLIVIDEEHETSFKQELTPRYHARDVAIMRARMEGCADHSRLGDAFAGKLAQRRAWPVHFAVAAEARAGKAVAARRPDRSAPRPPPRPPAARPQSEPGTSHAAGPEGRRAGDAAAQSPRLFHLRPLPGVRPRRAVQVLRPGPDVSSRNATSTSAIIAASRTRRSMQCPQCGLGQIRYQGLGTEKLQGRDRGEVSRLCRAPHGQRHHAPARQP